MSESQNIERQIKAVAYVKEHEAITNTEYQKLNDVSRATAMRELMSIVELQILKRSNHKGRGGSYTI